MADVPKLPPVKEVALVVRASAADVPKALGDALRQLPPTAERVSVTLEPPPTDGLLFSWECDYNPRERVTRTFYGGPSVTILGRLLPHFDEYTAVYLHPLAATTYRKPIETIRARNARLRREAWAEVDSFVADDGRA